MLPKYRWEETEADEAAAAELVAALGLPLPRGAGAGFTRGDDIRGRRGFPEP